MTHHSVCSERVVLTRVQSEVAVPQKESRREVRWFLEVTVDSRQTIAALLIEISGLVHGLTVLLRIGVVC